MFDANSAAIQNQVYGSDNSVSDNCWATGPLAEQPSPWARYGCDPSADLVEAMLQHFVETFGVPDVLLVTGDNLAHGIDKDRGEGSAAQY